MTMSNITILATDKSSSFMSPSTCSTDSTTSSIVDQCRSNMPDLVPHHYYYQFNDPSGVVNNKHGSPIQRFQLQKNILPDFFNVGRPNFYFEVGNFFDDSALYSAVSQHGERKNLCLIILKTSAKSQPLLNAQRDQKSLKMMHLFP